jgi:hypothetical protein
MTQFCFEIFSYSDNMQHPLKMRQETYLFVNYYGASLFYFKFKSFYSRTEKTNVFYFTVFRSTILFTLQRLDTKIGTLALPYLAILPSAYESSRISEWFMTLLWRFPTLRRYIWKCGAGEGWRRSVGPIVWEMNKYYKKWRRRGICYKK